MSPTPREGIAGQALLHAVKPHGTGFPSQGRWLPLLGPACLGWGSTLGHPGGLSTACAPCAHQLQCPSPPGTWPLRGRGPGQSLELQDGCPQAGQGLWGLGVMGQTLGQQDTSECVGMKGLMSEGCGTGQRHPQCGLRS